MIIITSKWLKERIKRTIFFDIKLDSFCLNFLLVPRQFVSGASRLFLGWWFCRCQFLRLCWEWIGCWPMLARCNRLPESNRIHQAPKNDQSYLLNSLPVKRSIVLWKYFITEISTPIFVNFKWIHWILCFTANNDNDIMKLLVKRTDFTHNLLRNNGHELLVSLCH